MADEGSPLVQPSFSKLLRDALATNEAGEEDTEDQVVEHSNDQDSPDSVLRNRRRGSPSSTTAEEEEEGIVR